MKDCEKLWVVYAVYGDADRYKEVSFHRTEVGALVKTAELNNNPVEHEEWGLPWYETSPRPLLD